mmetsp:Transcript_26158/g.62180  ORF Transcript_26158/g.62180 Transcript_26158/m.62180 type:complete len:246 (-) Transcript_26158:2-739(-)
MHRLNPGVPDGLAVRRGHPRPGRGRVRVVHGLVVALVRHGLRGGGRPAVRRRGGVREGQVRHGRGVLRGVVPGRPGVRREVRRGLRGRVGPPRSEGPVGRGVGRREVGGGLADLLVQQGGRRSRAGLRLLRLGRAVLPQVVPGPRTRLELRGRVEEGGLGGSRRGGGGRHLVPGARARQEVGGGLVAAAVRQPVRRRQEEEKRQKEEEQQYIEIARGSGLERLLAIKKFIEARVSGLKRTLPSYM